MGKVAMRPGCPLQRPAVLFQQADDLADFTGTWRNVPTSTDGRSMPGRPAGSAASAAALRAAGHRRIGVIGWGR
jgi:hypothetical protein